MKVDVRHPRGANVSQCVGLTSDALPEAQIALHGESLQTGVPTRSVPLDSSEESPNPKFESQWYALRTTYGREKKAYDYLVSKGVNAFLPTVVSTKVENGKRKAVTESRMPNIFFAYGTEDKIKTFVYDNTSVR